MSWGAIAAAAGGSILSAFGQHQANKQNIALSREQMQFQEKMSNTSYQRAMQDMRAAGLNPMLAYQQGGASSPAGSAAQVQNEMPDLQATASTAMDSLRLKKEIRAVDSQIGLNAQQGKAAEAQAKSAEAAALLSAQNAKKVKEETEILRNEKVKSANDRKFEDEYGSSYRKARALGELINMGTSSAADLLNPFKGFFRGGKTPPGSGNKNYKYRIDPETGEILQR